MSIIDYLVSNVAIATVLALFAALVGRVTVRPQITHTLWVLVLVKLVTHSCGREPAESMSQMDR